MSLPAGDNSSSRQRFAAGVHYPPLHSYFVGILCRTLRISRFARQRHWSGLDDDKFILYGIGERLFFKEIIQHLLKRRIFQVYTDLSGIGQKFPCINKTISGLLFYLFENTLQRGIPQRQRHCLSVTSGLYLQAGGNDHNSSQSHNQPRFGSTNGTDFLLRWSDCKFMKITRASTPAGHPMKQLFFPKNCFRLRDEFPAVFAVIIRPAVNFGDIARPVAMSWPNRRSPFQSVGLPGVSGHHPPPLEYRVKEIKDEQQLRREYDHRRRGYHPG